MAELTPEQLKAEQERLDLIQKQNEAAKELASTYEKTAKVKGKLSDEDKKLVSLSKQLSQFSSEIEKSVQKRISGTATSKDLSKQITKLELDQKVNAFKSEELQKSISKSRTEALAKARQASQNEKKIKNDIAILDESTTAAEIARQVHLRNGNAGLAKQAADIVKENQRLAAAKEKQLSLVNKEKEAQKELVKQLDKATEANEKIKEEQQKELELAKEALKQKKKEEALEVLKKQFRVDEIKEMLTLAGLLKIILDHAFIFNSVSVDISKNIGYGAGQADKMAGKMDLIAATTGNVNVTLKNLGEAMNQLNDATGGVADYSADTLETQVMLTKQFGLTGEEAAGIYKFSVLTGKSSSEVNKQMVAAFANTRNAVRGSADFKKTIAAAAKVSGELSANFQNNPVAITKAIVKMQALGTSIEQTKKQGDTLLDFESSIESELKAELLTGKQLNLERARAAALAGDEVTLAEELAKNIGSAAEFNKMNVLQRKALAESVGLTTDELAKQLQQAETAKQQGKSLAQVQADELEAAQKRQKIQDRFNATMEKLMDMIGKIGDLLEPIFNIFGYLTDHTWILYTVLGLIALSRLPAIAKAFSGIGSSIKDAAKNATKLFSKEGRGELLGGITGKKSAAPTPETGGAGKGMGGFMDKLKGVNTTDMIKGAAAILILSAALFVAAKAFQEFATVKWEDVGKGVLGIGALAGIAYLLGKATGDMIKGAVAVAVLGVALIPFAYAMSLIANLDIENVLAAAAGLVIFGAAVFGLGALMMTGVGAFIFGAGILAMIALGGAMIVLGLGLKAVSEGGKGVTELFKSLTELDIAKLNAIAPALGIIGDAVLKLGAGTVLTAIGGILGGKGPVGMIQEIAASGNGLQAAATGLQNIATALTGVSAALASIDVSKLEALSDFSTKMSIGAVVKGITDFITTPIKAIGGMIGGGAENKGNAEMVKAINDVKVAVDRLYNKEISIQIDGTKVGSTLTQGSYKVA